MPDASTVVLFLAQLVVGLSVFAVKSEIKAARELLNTRMDYIEKRLDDALGK